MASGSLDWPVQSADLVGAGNDRRRAAATMTPGGSWIAETKLTLDLGELTVRNFQQAGLIAYENDDDFARLSSVAIWNTRQTEFGRELPQELDATKPGPETIFGGAIIGTPAPTIWLRLAHTRNAAGEHLYRAGNQPRRPELDLGRGVDLRRPTRAHGSAWSLTVAAIRR